MALCAAGIVIRSLAPLLQNKRAEPPVLAVAEDGSAVVPLLGGLRGVNALARRIGAALAVAPAITTTGELRFGACLLDPPPGYALRNPADGKTFIADLLAGKGVRISGDCAVAGRGSGCRSMRAARSRSPSRRARSSPAGTSWSSIRARS